MYKSLCVEAIGRNVYLFKIKPGEEMTNKTFRLPVNLINRLNLAAKGGGVSLNNLVRQCCEYALGNMSNAGATSAKSGC